MSPDISKNKLIENLSHNGNVSALMFTNELDNASDNDKQDYGKLSPTLRQVFENENVGHESYLRGDKQAREPRMSFLGAGTCEQAKRFFKNSEDGFVSRTLAIFTPENVPYRSVDTLFLDEIRSREERKEKIKAKTKVFSAYCMQKQRIFLFSDMQNSEIEGFMTSSYEDVKKIGEESHRSVLFRFRDKLCKIMVILAALKACERNDTRDVIEMDDESVKLVLAFAPILLKHIYKLLSILPPVEDAVINNSLKQKRFYDELKETFTTKEANALGEKLRLSESTIKRCFKSWQKSGLLEKVGHGQYVKKIKTELNDLSNN